MAPLAKHLPHKLEERSSILNTHEKMAGHSSMPSLGSADQLA